MKRLVCMLLLVVTLATMLSACSLTCARCGEALSGKSYKTYDPNLIQKVEIEVCEDCYKEMGFDTAE